MLNTDFITPREVMPNLFRHLKFFREILIYRPVLNLMRSYIFCVLCAFIMYIVVRKIRQ